MAATAWTDKGNRSPLPPRTKSCSAPPNKSRASSPLLFGGAGGHHCDSSNQPAGKRANSRDIRCFCPANETSAPRAPVHAAQLVCDGKRFSFATRNGYLESPILLLSGQRAADHLTDSVIGRGRQNESRPLSALLRTSPGIEIEPDQMAPIRHIFFGHHQTSLPVGGPKSASSGFSAGSSVAQRASMSMSLGLI